MSGSLDRGRVPFPDQDQSVVAPAGQARAVTPTDGADLALGAAKALYVGGTGDVSVVCAFDTDAQPVVFVGVQGGTILPVRARRVRSTGTTASSIVALY